MNVLEKVVQCIVVCDGSVGVCVNGVSVVLWRECCVVAPCGASVVASCGVCDILLRLTIDARGVE